MRSMYSGVSGLRVHQTKMDVISNNIANINTVGFKRSTVSFKDSFNQTLSSASAANDERGGVNPQQIGLGANVGNVVTVMGQGAVQRTDYGSDLMIDGDGFFVVQDATGFSFTRAGAFEVDASGNLVDPNGFKVCGWKTIEDPDNPGKQKVIKERVQPINIYEGENLYVPAKQTTNIEFTGNFNPNTSPQKNTISFYDTIGNKYTMDIEFQKQATVGAGGNTTWNIVLPTPNQGQPGGIPIMFNGEKMYLQGNGFNVQNQQPTLEFDASGKLAPNANKNLQITFQNGNANGPIVLKNEKNEDVNTGGNLNSPITIDFSTVTQFNSKVTVTSNTKNGNAAGNMTGYSIDGNGMIRGVYSNGQSKILAQIPVADFRNPAGLEKVGNNLYKETGNSSEFDGIGAEVSSIGSKIQSGALEMSNVDLSYEFSEMITTQRGFQANSRIITASDEMIQELVNLKR